ncbi:MAG: DUF938 domain-containing protein [Rhodobacteraceae bacterium]|nr:DUF938 domain-containing protein [Paracoccaceae bacterium]
MPERGKPSEFVSVANATEGAKLSAPSALRNRDDVAAMLSKVAPSTGQALEIASGTGEHVVVFASVLPGLTWQPTEIDQDRRASIDAHAAETGLSNILPTIALDALSPGWGDEHHADLIHLGNLLHLISMPEATTLVSEAAKALKPGGVLSLYGPFMRGGVLTSDGDASFHAKLQAQDPAIGYKDDFDVIDCLQHAGLDMVDIIEMPANNLSLISRKAHGGLAS